MMPNSKQEGRMITIESLLSHANQFKYIELINIVFKFKIYSQDEFMNIQTNKSHDIEIGPKLEKGETDKISRNQNRSFRNWFRY